MSLKTNSVSRLGYYHFLLNPFSFIRRFIVRILAASQNDTQRHMPEYGIISRHRHKNCKSRLPISVHSSGYVHTDIHTDGRVLHRHT
jgi:hypothetical protein